MNYYFECINSEYLVEVQKIRISVYGSLGTFGPVRVVGLW